MNINNFLFSFDSQVQGIFVLQLCFNAVYAIVEYTNEQSTLLRIKRWGGFGGTSCRTVCPLLYPTGGSGSIISVRLTSRWWESLVALPLSLLEPSFSGDVTSGIGSLLSTWLWREGIFWSRSSVVNYFGAEGWTLLSSGLFAKETSSAPFPNSPHELC